MKNLAICLGNDVCREELDKVIKVIETLGILNNAVRLEGLLALEDKVDEIINNETYIKIFGMSVLLYLEAITGYIVNGEEPKKIKKYGNDLIISNGDYGNNDYGYGDFYCLMFLRGLLTIQRGCTNDTVLLSLLNLIPVKYHRDVKKAFNDTDWKLSRKQLLDKRLSNISDAYAYNNPDALVLFYIMDKIADPNTTKDKIYESIANLSMFDLTCLCRVLNVESRDRLLESLSETIAEIVKSELEFTCSISHNEQSDDIKAIIQLVANNLK